MKYDSSDSSHSNNDLFARIACRYFIYAARRDTDFRQGNRFGRSPPHPDHQRRCNH